MKEYGIYIIRRSGSPYIIGNYNTIYDAKESLDNMLSIYKRNRRLYFVDNDFFENKFPNSISGDYYCIKERNISEWKVYSEFNIDNKKRKILEFNKYL